MTLTVRSASVTGATTAARALTHAEMDANWAHVIQSANQTFLPSGTGAVATDLQARGRILVFASDYGSKLLTTPGADINQAITYVNSLASGGTVKVNPGSYTIETSILQKSNVYLDLTGVTLTAKTGLNAPVIMNATSVTSLSISGISKSVRTATATTTTVHGFAVNDWVHISGASPDGYSGWHKVLSVPLT